MKKIITIILLLHLIILAAYSQNSSSIGFMDNSDIEVSGMVGITRDAGFILKLKKELMKSARFEGFGSLAFQRTYWSETSKLLSGVEGFHRDIGAFAGFDILYFFSKKKRVFIGSEIYFGITNLKSKGNLNIPDHHINKNYSKSYSFVNYGLTETIGCRFGRVNTGLFVRSSLKGYLDNGRTRPADYDSKIFMGICFSYSIRPYN